MGRTLEQPDEEANRWIPAIAILLILVGTVLLLDLLTIVDGLAQTVLGVAAIVGAGLLLVNEFA